MEIPQFLSLIENDDFMLSVVDKVGPCMIGCNKQCIFSYLVGLIIGQKIRFTRARKIRSNLYTLIGYNFEPKDILSISDWSSVKCESWQQERIINVAKYCDEHQLVTKENILKLREINGVGEWTVTTLLIEYGFDLDLFPSNDLHVNRLVKKHGIVVDDYKPYRSVLFWYLWKFGL